MMQVHVKDARRNTAQQKWREVMMDIFLEGVGCELSSKKLKLAA